MARMKLELPEIWQFSTELEIRVTDLNYGNHLANQQFLAYAQEARLKYFRQFGFTELDFGGVALIQADAAITFKSEGHLGEIIRVDLSAEIAGSSSFNVYYRFWNLNKNRSMAELRTAIVCFDYDIGKPIGLPLNAVKSGLFLAEV
jgi:acyl-CoA thioester hydrolase